MECAAKNAPARILRAEAGASVFFALSMEAKSARRELDIKLRYLQDRVKQLSGNKRAKTNEDVRSLQHGVCLISISLADYPTSRQGASVVYMAQQAWR